MAGIIVAVVVADLLWCCKSEPIRPDAVALLNCCTAMHGVALVGG